MASSSFCFGQQQSQPHWPPWQWTHLGVWNTLKVWLLSSDAHFLQTLWVLLHHFIVCPYWLHFRHIIGLLLNGYTTESHLSPGMYIEYGVLLAEGDYQRFDSYLFCWSLLVQRILLFQSRLKVLHAFQIKFSYIDDSFWLIVLLVGLYCKPHLVDVIGRQYQLLTVFLFCLHCEGVVCFALAF